MRYPVWGAVLMAMLPIVATAQRLPQDTKTIRTLTVEQARELAKGSIILHLEGLTELPPDVARALAPFKGTLVLGVTELSDEAAMELAMGKGDELQLERITRLSDKAAVALAMYEGNLSMNRLTTLSPKAAKAFARRDHETELLGLTELSDEAAWPLGRTEDRLYIKSSVRMSAKAAARLRDNPNIRWDQTIPPPLMF